MENIHSLIFYTYVHTKSIRPPFHRSSTSGCVWQRAHSAAFGPSHSAHSRYASAIVRPVASLRAITRPYTTSSGASR